MRGRHQVWFISKACHNPNEPSSFMIMKIITSYAECCKFYAKSFAVKVLEYLDASSTTNHTDINNSI